MNARKVRRITYTETVCFHRRERDDALLDMGLAALFTIIMALCSAGFIAIVDEVFFGFVCGLFATMSLILAISRAADARASHRRLKRKP